MVLEEGHLVADIGQPGPVPLLVLVQSEEGPLADLEVLKVAVGGVMRKLGIVSVGA
jgi:hypothetical protein